MIAEISDATEVLIVELKDKTNGRIAQKDQKTEKLGQGAHYQYT